MPLRVVEGSGNSGSHHFRELIQEARWCFLANNVERARELFERASQIEPHHPEVLHGLGVVALKEGRYKEAVSLLQQAVGKDPRFAEAWNNLGFALFKKGRHSEAKKALEKAVELEPEERSYRENLQALSRGNPPKAKPKNQPPFLSLCMIVRDEAANLRMYLAQIVDLFEDIVVIDTGSRDNTREIAASLGARVFPFSWNNDFSAARNESLRRARGEWILVLDADEVVEREGIQGLREITRNTQATGFQLPIYNYNGAGKVGVINFALRFFRRHPGIRFAGKIHETVETSIVDLGGIIGRANIPIHHFGYTDSDALRRKSLERNLPIIEEILRSEPDNIQAFLYVAKTRLVYLGERDTARNFLLRIVRNPEWRGKPAYVEGLFYLGSIFADEGKTAVAERIFERVRRYDPHLPDALFALGNLAFLRKDYSRALQLLEAIFAVDPGKARTNLARFAFTDEALYERLTRSAIESGQTAKAIAYGEKLRELLPEDLNVLHNLALAYFQGGRYVEAESLWREVLQKDPLHAEARSLLFYLYTLQDRPEEARRVLQEVEVVF